VEFSQVNYNKLKGQIIVGLYQNIHAMLLQHMPTESFVAALNEYEHWINGNNNDKWLCFINNDECTMSSDKEKRAQLGLI